MPEFINSALSDSFVADARDDRFVISGPGVGAGDDLFYGGGGNDLMQGGIGNDILSAGAGISRIFGGDGNDQITISGQDGDRVFGGAGFDVLYITGGEAGLTIDVTAGRAGDIRFAGFERIDASFHDDTMIGGAGNDTFYGGTGADFLQGGAGDDLLAGDSLFETDRDRVVGGRGADTLFSTGHGDRLFGGRGLDTAWVFSESDQTVQLGRGLRSVNLGDDGRVLFRSIESWRSGAGDDTLSGTGRANNLTAGDGNDLLYGGGGQDYLFGEGGDDSLYAGGGSDVMQGGAGADRFVYYTLPEGRTDVGAIQDFETGVDKIDLSGLFLGLREVNPVWIGSAAFSGLGDEVRFDAGRLQVSAPGEVLLVMDLAITGTVTAGDLIL